MMKIPNVTCIATERLVSEFQNDFYSEQNLAARFEAKECQSYNEEYSLSGATTIL